MVKIIKLGKFELDTIYLGDCLELMKDIPDESINMVLCDLPYGITKNKWDIPLSLENLWKQYRRIIKSNGIIILTAVQPYATDLISSNRKWFKYDLIYEKTLGSGFLNAKRMPLRYHEHILIFYDKLPVYNPIMGVGVRKRGINKSLTHGTNYGKKTKFNYAYDDKGKRYPKSIITFSTGNRTKNRYHPTQKPVKLGQYLIKTYSNKGDIMLDNCCGGGSFLISAIKESRHFLGFEINPEYVKITNNRLKSVQVNML